LEPIFPDLLFSRGQGLALHLPPDFVFINQVQVHITGYGPDIGPICQGCQFLQAFFIHPRKDDIAGPVFFKTAFFIGDGGSFRPAHTDTENPDAFFGHGFGHLFGIALGIFTVRDENHGFFRVGFFFKAVVSCFQGFGKVGAAHGQKSRGQYLEKNIKGLMVQGQGALEQSSPGKGHQPGPVGFHHAQKINDLPFGPFQPVGLDIPGQHTFGAVQGDHEIHPFFIDGLPSVPPLGTGQGHHHTPCGQGDKCGLDPPAVGIISRNNRGKHPGFGKPGQNFLSLQDAVGHDAKKRDQHP